MRRFLLCMILIGLCAPSVARAEPVQEFGFTIKDVKTDGRYTLDFSSRAYDTTGQQPPTLTKNYLRLPSGIEFIPQVATAQYQCNTGKLMTSLIGTPDPKTFLSDRVANLKAAYAKARAFKNVDGPVLNADELKNYRTCMASQIGRGTVQVDIRAFFAELIPVRIFVFLGNKSDPKAQLAFQVMAIPDERAKIVIDNPIISSVRPTFTLNVFKESSGDGKYGYRITLPSGRGGFFKFSLADLRVQMTGLTHLTPARKCPPKKRCPAIYKKPKKQFWLTRPKCPASQQLDFLAHYEYETGRIDEASVAVPCPTFK